MATNCGIDAETAPHRRRAAPTTSVCSVLDLSPDDCDGINFDEQLWQTQSAYFDDRIGGIRFAEIFLSELKDDREVRHVGYVYVDLDDLSETRPCGLEDFGQHPECLFCL